MDFITALGRLLHDGALRDAFAAAPAGVADELRVRESDRPALLGLTSHDLEIQAEVLLRKRFDLVRNIIPGIVSFLGEGAWPHFLKYSRYHWPQGENREFSDALAFGRHCQTRLKSSLPVYELNRLDFIVRKKFVRMHLIRGMPVRNQTRNGFQIILCKNSNRWRELFISAGL